MKTVAIKLPVKNDSKILWDAICKMELEKYNIPYERKTFNITIKKTFLITFGEKTSDMSSPIEKNSSLSLKIK
ncbi:hypothetical protein [Methanobrevibacter sp.]|uniref:hypothetical protein n=1 Tax=Methanobrevibacter sp. TaxID=66852 RepID=UPI0025D4C6C3|nr:hypothetical protein [Methanobrevibacter sp.]MBQ2665352.1 hypothetical protein [Methanobrevibacter sp.]